MPHLPQGRQRGQGGTAAGRLRPRLLVASRAQGACRRILDAPCMGLTA